jgi:multidrug efflux pump subunit AcrA (membrane-fusion protein)
MPAKRQYHVKGTNDFIILAAIFFLLCIWAIKDAWFPSEKVLKKHPLEVVVAFEAAGTVKDVRVSVGDMVAENEVLAELRSDRVAVDYDKAKEAYGESKKQLARLESELRDRTGTGASAGELAELRKQLGTVQQEMDTALNEVEDLRNTLDASVLKAPSKGQILEVGIAPHAMITADQTAFVIDPKDHFYTFNKSLTVLSFILFWAFLAVHVLAR